jgi:predicted DCC family thiol-disulfide oxidoreductase YuxK
MPDNPSSFSRNFAANSVRSHMQFHQRMAKHGRQAQARQLEQMRALNREASRQPDLEYLGDAVPQPRRWRRTGVILLVLAALAVGAWLVGVPSNPVLDTIFGVHATVRPGSDWNVRRGRHELPIDRARAVRPGRDCGLRPGQLDQITSPMTGFVHSEWM